MKAKQPVLATLILGTTLALAGAPSDGQAQSSCQRIGNSTFCDNGTTTQDIGNQRFYNHSNPQRAQQQGLPSSSQQIGNTRIYDNGATRQTIGNTDFYSNGVTRQRIGDTDFYSNGRTCQRIGDQTLCN